MFAAGSSPELVRTFEDNLRAFIARRVRPDELDDVTQEVFLRLLRSADDLRDEQRLEAWVYRVARSAIVDQYRTRARHALFSRMPIDLDTELALAESDDEGDGSAERELVGCVAQFVATLPSPYREALTLTELVGMTQGDAAAKLGISLSGMKSRVQRGRLKLREAFEACCDIALDTRGRVIACEPRAAVRSKDCCD